MARLFGTDGVRGVANIAPMTAEMALAIGRATAYVCKRHKERRHSVVIGKDTRVSGYMLESALTAGICSMGVDVLLVGPLPTPGIAFITRSMRADAGLVISASHNPYQDNGIKIFSLDGYKLPDGEEDEIENLITSGRIKDIRPTAEEIGKARRIDDAIGRYIVFCKNTFSDDVSLEGLKIVLDCANGATYRVAPTIFSELGADVTAIHVEPNGININDHCGSQHTQDLCAKVKELKADVGLAFDGDGDRMIAIDEKGHELTGDHVLAICGKILKDRGQLKNNMIVPTVMANFGFFVAMKKIGIQTEVAQVGDRYVLEKMKEKGAVLGGEASGHLIFHQHHTTGDGIISALQLLAAQQTTKQPLSKLAAIMSMTPQKMINIDVKQKPPLDSIPEIKKAIHTAEAELKDEGRVLVRYSGTQSMCRVMVEGPTVEITNRLTESLAATISKMHRLMRVSAFILVSVLFPLCANATRTEPKEFDFGPIVSRHKDVHGEWHLKAAGPIFEAASSTQDMHFVATRPLYSAVEDPVHDRTAEDYLWPLATKRSLKNQSNWRVLFFFGFNHDTEVKKPRYRLWLFPFYFQGRDARGLKYRAVFPFGGSIHEFLGRDEINFVLFPIRTTSTLNDLRTSNWLWPIVSETKGDETYRWRVFPLYGYSRRDGDYEKKFILWPFWSQVRYDYTNSSGSGFILFPFVGHIKLTDQETWWAVPPFFKFTRGDKLDQIFCPWPFFQYAKSHDPGELDRPLIERVRGKGYEKLYLWPLWGHKHVGNVDQSFWLWPLIWRHEVERVGLTQHRFRVVPFLISVRDEATSGDIVNRYNKFWPLYSYRREGPDSRFRVLDLWPFAEARAVERNWAPLWTLYSRMGSGENTDSEFLWGLYRNQKRGGEGRYFSIFPIFDWKRDNARDRLRRWNLLKGLIGYERDDSRSRIRLLYFLHLNLGTEKNP